MPTVLACLWRRVEAIQLGRVPTHFGPATRLRRPKSQWNQGALATSQVEMCPRTANSGLRDLRSLRLAVLNSCEGARNSRTDPFAGTATTLVRQGSVPAVVAMQFE